MRGYSRLKKAELIAFLQDNAPQEPQALRRQIPPRPSRPPPPPPQMSTWEPIDDRLRPDRSKSEEAPLTKRQLKQRRNMDSKLNKKFKNLEKEIKNLKSQMDSLITKASRSTNARFKRKKIRSLKRDFDKINEKLTESEKKLELVEPRVLRDPLHGDPLKIHPPNRNRHI